MKKTKNKIKKEAFTFRQFQRHVYFKLKVSKGELRWNEMSLATNSYMITA